jgi:hypothetical protein
LECGVRFENLRNDIDPNDANLLALRQAAVADLVMIEHEIGGRSTQEPEPSSQTEQFDLAA